MGFRNTALDANSFFQKAAGAPKPIFRQNQYGGTLGGPLRRNKAFFFFSYQGTDQANGISSTSNKTTFLPIVGDRTRQTLGALYGGKTGLFGGVAVANDGSNINPVAIALERQTRQWQYAIQIRRSSLARIPVTRLFRRRRFSRATHRER
jgi:hypothetical protein